MRELTQEDSGNEYIQFRGFQSSVTMDSMNLLFTNEQKDLPYDHGLTRYHTPKPVADQDAILAGDAPKNAVSRNVAEAITNGDLSNPNVCWGVACEWHDPETGEECNAVFDTVQGLNGHLHTHYQDGSDGSEDDADQNASEASQSGDDEDATEDTPDDSGRSSGESRPASEAAGAAAEDGEVSADLPDADDVEAGAGTDDSDEDNDNDNETDQ